MDALKELGILNVLSKVFAASTFQIGGVFFGARKSERRGDLDAVEIGDIVDKGPRRSPV